jgi:hypothetical protein
MVGRSSLHARLLRGLREPADRFRSEQGIALPVALLMLLIVGLVAAAVALTAVAGSSQSSRDRGVKRAVAAADAGISAALYRLNKLAPLPLSCVALGPGGLGLEAIPAGGWCDPQTENLGDGASYSYRVSAGVNVTVNGQDLLQRKIVATGCVLPGVTAEDCLARGGVKRRALTVAASATGRSLFGDYAVISLSDLNLPNSSIIGGSAGSNGNIALTNSSEICGNVTYGASGQFTTANTSHQCPGYVNGPAAQPFVLNPVDPGDSATVNDNLRIGALDPLSGAVQTIWDVARRVLVLRNDAVLTLTGDVYSFCYLELSNSAQLLVAPRDSSRPPLKIFIEDPANCPGVIDAGSVRVRNNSSIQNLNSDPITLQIMAVGNPQRATSIEFSNSFSSEVPMVVYAPHSTVSFQNNQNVVGAVAAQTVEMTNSARVRYHQAVGGITVDGLETLYRRQSWVECPVQVSGPVPDAGC